MHLCVVHHLQVHSVSDTWLLLLRHALVQCFSTGVLQWSLRVSPEVSKGSAELNREKWELKTTFAVTSCVFWELSTSEVHLRLELHPEPRWENLCRSPKPPSSLLNPKNLFPTLGNHPKFHDFLLHKFLPTLVGSVNNQHCCKGFHFEEKVENAALVHRIRVLVHSVLVLCSLCANRWCTSVRCVMYKCISHSAVTILPWQWLAFLLQHCLHALVYHCVLVHRALVHYSPVHRVLVLRTLWNNAECTNAWCIVHKCTVHQTLHGSLYTGVTTDM